MFSVNPPTATNIDFEYYPRYGRNDIYFARTPAEKFNLFDEFGFVVDHYTIGDADTRTQGTIIPGRNGEIDLTEALGRPYFDNRQIDIFLSCPDRTKAQAREEASRLRNRLKNNKWHIKFSDDRGYFWVGRCDVDIEKVIAYPVVEATIKCTVEPFKKQVWTEPWLWNDCNFNDHISRLEVVERVIVSSGEVETYYLNIDNSESCPVFSYTQGAIEVRVPEIDNDSMWQPYSTEWLKIPKSADGARLPQIRADRKSQVMLEFRGSGTIYVGQIVGSL